MFFLSAQQGWYWQFDIAPFMYTAFEGEVGVSYVEFAETGNGKNFQVSNRYTSNPGDISEMYGLGVGFQFGYHYVFKSGLFFDWRIGGDFSFAYGKRLPRMLASEYNKNPPFSLTKESYGDIAVLELTSFCIGMYINKDWAGYGLVNPFNLFTASVNKVNIKGFGLKAGLGLWHKASGFFCEATCATPIWSEPGENFGRPLPFRIALGMRSGFNSSKAAQQA